MCLSYVLGAELAGTGIAVTIVAPGLFRTEMAQALPSQQAAPGSRFTGAFRALAKSSAEQLKTAGDPEEAGAEIEKLIRSEAPPARLVLGEDGAQVENFVRASNPEELAARLRGSVLKLLGD